MKKQMKFEKLYGSKDRGSGEEDKSLSIKEYLEEIRSYLCDIINEHKNKNE